MSRRRRNHLLWVGPALTLVGAWSYFAVFARYPELRDTPWLNLVLVGAGVAAAALGVVRAFRRRSALAVRILGSVGLGLTLVVATFFCAYVFVLSYRLPPPTAMATELVDAPPFELPDQHGRSVSLASLRGTRVVLVFYRGYW